MDIKSIKAAVECILFVSGDPVSLKDLAGVLDIDQGTLKKIINQLMDDFDDETRGIKIIEINGSYQMCSKSEFYEFVEKLFKPKAKGGLSQASLETLSIIAYKQPITKSSIDSIRGVKSDACITRLVEKEIIKEIGRMDTPGRPILYGTTDNFLRLFGLKNIGDLPTLKDFD
ncbi:MAG: SMC-Scp complex subunit ScpB [Lutispora sp.]|nr:SMC-Scp complex subunit ScpB [Lutispora sp.]